MALEVKVEQAGGTHTIRAQGEVDLSTSPKLREAILGAMAGSAERVAVDLSGVQYMDSSGVATLVEGLKKGREKGRAFVLQHPSAPVMKVLQLSRLDSVFEIEGTE